MPESQIKPERIANPIQLLAAALVFVILLDASFLAAASSISSPPWVPPLLAIAAVLYPPFVLAIAFRLQTRHRPALLADKEYLRYQGALIKSTKEAQVAAEERGEELQVTGDPDQMALLFKAKGEGWQKSTKAMQVPDGCLVQVSTERVNAAGAVAVAEALEFVPNVQLALGPDGTYALTTPS